LNLFQCLKHQGGTDKAEACSNWAMPASNAFSADLPGGCVGIWLSALQLQHPACRGPVNHVAASKLEAAWHSDTSQFFQSDCQLQSHHCLLCRCAPFLHALAAITPNANELIAIADAVQQQQGLPPLPINERCSALPQQLLAQLAPAAAVVLQQGGYQNSASCSSHCLLYNVCHCLLYNVS
jgi:hypothetical protein